MFSGIKQWLIGSCTHMRISKIEKRLWENKCDCCGKVLFSKEAVDFNIESIKDCKEDDLLMEV